MQRKWVRVFDFCALFLAAALLSGCVQVTVLPGDSPTPAGVATPTATVPPATPTAQATSTPAPTAAPAETPAQTPTPTDAGIKMYSSYANLVSYDPDSNVAQFDYFDMLRGDDAVAYLVDHEGYTQADAQAYVDAFSDSEFVLKNTNSQLRSVELVDVSLKLMIQPSGEPVDGAESIPSSTADFRAIYALDPALLLDTYFYYIHVESDGHVSLVEQVYWP